jgi:hypothetical protein
MAKRNPIAKALAHGSKRPQVVPDKRRALRDRAERREQGEAR